jgi:hypothetical protein
MNCVSTCINQFDISRENSFAGYGSACFLFSLSTFDQSMLYFLDLHLRGVAIFNVKNIGQMRRVELKKYIFIS